MIKTEMNATPITPTTGTTTTPLTLSAQEAAVESGKTIMHGTVTDRVLRLYEAVRNFGPPRASIERAVLFTESFKETEGQPTVLRWAKGLQRFAEKSPIAIFPDELIVGRPAPWLGRYAIVYPELDGSVMPLGVDAFHKAKGKPNEVVVTDEDDKTIREVLTPYWTGKDYATAFALALPEEVRFPLFGPDRKNTLLMTCVLVATTTMRHSQNWTVDFEKILKRGVKGIREEAQAKLAALQEPVELAKKKPFLEAVILSCDAIRLWTQRHAAEARALAAKENNAQRKKELEEIADICEWVPENPARTFREALQSQWFIANFARIEVTSGAQGQGRMDQYLWPYYKKDIAEGRLTKDAAMELLECLWIGNVQVVEIKMNPVFAAGADGFAQFLDVCVGGTDAGGLDATNELSYLILESLRPLQLVGVDGCVRIHANTPDAFLHHVAECIKDGKGYPKLVNDEMVIPFYLAAGATLKEANNWVISGCCENRLINRETHVTGNGALNYGAVLEMTLRNGKMKFFKDVQFGLQTGDPRNWKSYDEVWKAFVSQIEFFGKSILTAHYIAMGLKPNYFASPVTSMLHDLAMKECRDLQSHGEFFPGAIDHSCFEGVGKGTVVDSFAAIKHLIFDTKRLTWDQLLTAIEANWEGHEAIRQLCVNAPKYGNGIEWVDDIGYQLETAVLQFLNKHPKPHDQYFLLRQIPITFHVPLGRITSATPNGRRSGEYLSEGISPSHGMDLKGPTVSLNSMARARNRSFREKGGDLINMKFSPATLAGEEGTRRLMQIIRTWSQHKHWHIQFNILNKQTLLTAQKEPEKYRNLIVRIAGYSAYFVDLSPAQQAELIARTEEQIG
jgi:isethionate sulfite-lyase